MMANFYQLQIHSIAGSGHSYDALSSRDIALPRLVMIAATASHRLLIVSCIASVLDGSTSRV